MKKKPEPKLTAKQVAFADIAEECKKQKEGQNYILFENEICESLGIKKPDFRRFNGGHNKTESRIFVTFYMIDEAGVRRDFAIKCKDEGQVSDCASLLSSRPGVRNVRVNRCGEIKNKSAKIVMFEEFKKQQ